MEKTLPGLLRKQLITVKFDEIFSLKLFFFLYSAKDKKFDVVLIDTAGRMQNDEPLMIALAKVMNFHLFININRIFNCLVNSCE